MRRSNRALVRRPGFLLLASVTLSMGTAVMTSAFTLLDTVLRQPPPWPNHERVAVYGGRTAEDPMRAASPRLYNLVGSPSSVRSRGIARIPESVNAIHGVHRGLLRAQRVDAGFLPTLGVVPVRGTWLDARAGHTDVMISYSLWKRWLEDDADPTGRSLLVDGQAMRISGVLPADYRFFTDVDLILPMEENASGERAENLTAVALLPHRDDIEGFSRDVWRVAGANAASLRLGPEDIRWYGAAPLDSLVARDAHGTLWLCMACALLVLTVAGMNVSNLMLTRALGRAHETALKLALGATGWRPWLPAITDAVAVALLASMIGIPIGGLLVVALRNVVPEAWLSSAMPLAPDWRVFVAVTVCTVAVAMIAALGALASVRMESMLRDRAATSGQSSAGRSARRTHAAMLLAQTALAAMLLTLGVAAVARWWRLEQIPLGFDRSRAMVVELRADPRQYAGLRDVSLLLDRIRARAAQLPGVESVGWSTQLPVGDGFVMTFQRADGKTLPMQYVLVTVGAMEAMGLRKTAGRWFTDADGSGADHVAMVNEAYLAEVDRHGLDGVTRLASEQARKLRIVGIVGDTKRAGASEPVQPTVFVPLDQADPTSFGFVRQLVPLYVILRGPDITPATGYAFARVVLDSAPSLALGPVRTLDRVARAASSAQRRDAVLLAVFAVFAMALASVGHYSVQSVDVVMRRRTYALRGALGATPMNLLCDVLRRALATTLPGVALGLLMTVGSRLWLCPVCGGIGVVDLWVIATVVFAMVLATVCAVAIPALRAAAVEPWRVLRSD